MEFDDAAPNAASLIESLRAFGYDLRTAMADIVDNSIAAGAQRVWVKFAWQGKDSTIAIRDDGNGMDGQELVTAMRLGTRSPLEERALNDLGRFGLGLKTASFSQCRLLCVASRKQDEEIVARCWDLDYVSRFNEWRLLRTAPSIFEEDISDLNLTNSGTVVLWHKLDRLVGDASPLDAQARDHFYALADTVKQHLSMTFGDFLRGKSPTLRIYINGNPLVPWDPFLIGHSATQSLPIETIHSNGYQITVSPYVLPHYNRIPEGERVQAGGAEGWNARQGFYIYRNGRLLVAGDWLGLGFRKEEHFSLARIRLDMPNCADLDWQLDVKKSRAFPPSQAKEQLRRLAQLTRHRSSEVFRHRGARLIPPGGTDVMHLWEQRRRRGKIFYSINQEHPLVSEVVATSTNSRAVKTLISLLQESVPIPLIAINNTETPAEHALPYEGVPNSEVHSAIRGFLAVLQKGGLSLSQAKARLATVDAFRAYPELIASIDPEGELGEGEA